MLSGIRWIEVAFALGSLLTVGILSVAVSTQHAALTTLLVVPLCALLLLRRSAPLVSSIGIYALSLLQVFVFGTPLPVNFVVLFALYSVTVYGSRAAGVVALIGGYIGAVIFSLMLAPWWWSAGESLFYFIPTAFAVTVAWALGLVRRSRRERGEALEERERALAAGRHSEAELAVAAERARIAREMHDVVAHSLAVIIAQADGGRYAARQDPEVAVKALETVADIGRASLSDIRRILGVLRSEDGDGPLVQPQPTGEDLEELVQRVRDTGAHVSYVTLGEPKPLLPGMGLALQRVCQEALTNSLKHAGPGAKMSVLLQWTDDVVILQVDDDGRGAAALTDGAGGGLVGMRERAQLFGGHVVAGPRPTGGFRVKLTLPLQPVKEPV
ncbi:MAG: sensor histidine kinase [Propionibacterium sp.]|nr:sensor histidine kinase [Propionibacterium sp.]